MDQPELIFGDIFSLLEGYKITKEDHNFDKKPKILKVSSKTKENQVKPNTFSSENSFLNEENKFFFYECVIFNENKEDSLYFHDGNELYEYFSNDRCELILKLLKIYSHKYIFHKEKVPSQPKLNSKQKLSNEKYKKMLAYSQKQSELICEKIFCNVYIEYYSLPQQWLINFEVKRLLFNMKFLPNYSKIRLIRLFPLEITPLSIQTSIKSYTFTDTEDKIGKNNEEIDYDSFCYRIKSCFHKKYGLNLKKFESDAIEIEGFNYIFKVKELKFERFDSNFIELKSKRYLRTFKNNYKYFNLNIDKSACNIKDIESLLSTMISVYNQSNNKNNIQKYLTFPKRNSHSDDSFMYLKPDIPYLLSEMLEDKFDSKEFAKYCSSKLYINY